MLIAPVSAVRVVRHPVQPVRPVSSARVPQACLAASPVADSAPEYTSGISLHRSFCANLEGDRSRGSTLTYMLVDGRMV